MTRDAQQSPAPSTLGRMMEQAQTAFRAAGIETARLDARLLLAAAANVDSSRIAAWPEDVVDPAGVDAFGKMVARRLDREPVSRILGQRDFWRYSFRLSADTLDPRPDSETLVEWALERLDLADANARPAARAGTPPGTVLDFGTGTGCLLLSILGDMGHLRGLGVDISAGAVACATENARDLGLSDRVEFRVSDWDSAITDDERARGFDAVIANPPYITRDEMETLSPEVRKFDPRRALTDEGDGLAAYRILAGVAFDLVAPGGFVLFEIGQGQENDVASLIAEAGFTGIDMREDLGGIIRCVGGTKSPCSVGRCVI